MNTLCFCEGKVFHLICSGSIACFKVIKYCVTLQFKSTKKSITLSLFLYQENDSFVKGRSYNRISSEHSPGMAVHISGKLSCC
jgi:hypothetical protein